MKVATREASWECACSTDPEDHRPTIGRAWCFACTEWCYPSALCVRGDLVRVQGKVREALDLVGHLPEGNRAAGAVARVLREALE
jgi:hypothetical protein